jgi:phosphatidylglycerophosphatase A
MTESRITRFISRQIALRQDFLKTANAFAPETLIATWFGSGLLLPAPGTWGTLGGFGIALLIAILSSPVFLFPLSLALFAAGIWAVRKLESRGVVHDSGLIVIDEVAAIFLVLSALPEFSASYAFAAFLLFRLFDAAKPWPVSWADRTIPGAWGVMLDDTLAALYTLIVLWGYQYGIAG